MEKSKEFFDNMASNWDKNRNLNWERLNFLLSLLDIDENSKILDVGTGTGALIPFLLTHLSPTGKIDAIDYSTEMIKIANQKQFDDRVSFFVGNILKYPLKKEYYDFIISLNFFPHLTNLENKQNYLEIAKNSLKNGGTIAIIHDISREKVNGIHEHKKETLNDKLPAAIDTAKLLLNTGYSFVKAIEDDYIYFVKAKK